MKKCIFMFILFVVYQNVFTQTIQNDVVATGGGHATAGNFDMEFTIGEPVIETLQTPGLVMTQGFLQPALVITFIEEPDMLANIGIFPNPVRDELTIEIPADYKARIQFHLFDLNGKLLQSGEFYQGTNTLEMHSYSTATYFLKITDTSSGRQMQTKILKIR